MASHFASLTDFIDKLSAESPGEWAGGERLPNGSVESGYVNYSHSVMEFLRTFYDFQKAHPEYDLTNYKEILGNNNINWGASDMRCANSDNLDDKCVLALITAAIRADRFSEGALLGFLEDGCIVRWLERMNAAE